MTTTAPQVTKVAPFKSERAAKLAMTKLDKKYDAAINARNSVSEKARESGWDDEMFAERAKHEAEMAAILVEMDVLKAQATSQKFYVRGQWHSYYNSTHHALVCANMD